MGIKGLTKLLNDEAPGCIKEAELSSYTGRKVAIDASMALYQFIIAIRSGSEGFAAQVLTNEQGEVTSHIQGIFNRTIRMLTNGIKPVYVFDGKPPTLKSGELAKRMARRQEAQSKLEAAETVEDKEKYGKRLTRVTRKHSEDAMKLLGLMGVPVVQAPCEAEAQCAELARAGLVWATGTEDMDALCFRTPKLLRRLTFGGGTKQPVMEVDYQKAIDGLGLSYEQFVDLCILCGCDYTDTIKGIGPKTALKLIRVHGNLDEVVKSLDKKKYQVPSGWIEGQDEPPKADDVEEVGDEVEEGAAQKETGSDEQEDDGEQGKETLGEPKEDEEAPTSSSVLADSENAPAVIEEDHKNEENQKDAANRQVGETDVGGGESVEKATAIEPVETSESTTVSNAAAGETPDAAGKGNEDAPFEPLFSQARRFFVTPEIKPPSEVELQWGPPDEAGLRTFLVDEMGFNAERVESGIRRLRDSRKMGSQSRMDSFFKSSGTVSSQTASSKRKAAEAKKQKNKRAKGAKGGAKKRR